MSHSLRGGPCIAGVSERRLVGFEAAGWKLEEELAGGVAVLALKDNDGIGGVAGLDGVVDGEDDYGAVVADDVADVAVAGGLDDGVGVDVEDFAFVGEFGGDEVGFFVFGGGDCRGGTGFDFSGGLLGRFPGGHIPTVSSCIEGRVEGIQTDEPCGMEVSVSW